MELDFTGRRALVTGGTRGIGLAIALAFARRGARTALTFCWGGEEDAARAAFEAEGLPVPPMFQADVAEPEDTRALMEALGEALGGVDVFVSNVALGRPAVALSGLTERDLQKAIRYGAWPLVSYTEAIRHAFGPGPRDILGLSSFGHLRYHPDYDALAAAKAALEALARYLAHHLHPEGARVNVLRASYVHTRSLDAVLGEGGAAFLDAHGQLLSPALVADAAVALCCGLMAGMTGQVLDVDGGGTFYDNPMHRFAQDLALGKGGR